MLKKMFVSREQNEQKCKKWNMCGSIYKSEGEIISCKSL